MFVWQHFDIVIADECSSGSVSILLLLMSARPTAFDVVIADECSSGSVSMLLLLMSARLSAFRCCYC